jgi:hypothetical protein
MWSEHVENAVRDAIEASAASDEIVHLEGDSEMADCLRCEADDYSVTDWDGRTEFWGEHWRVHLKQLPV